MYFSILKCICMSKCPHKLRIVFLTFHINVSVTVVTKNTKWNKNDNTICCVSRYWQESSSLTTFVFTFTKTSVLITNHLQLPYNFLNYLCQIVTQPDRESEHQAQQVLVLHCVATLGTNPNILTNDDNNNKQQQTTNNNNIKKKETSMSECFCSVSHCLTAWCWCVQRCSHRGGGICWAWLYGPRTSPWATPSSLAAPSSCPGTR